MRVLRTAFAIWMMMCFLPISAVWAAGAGSPASAEDDAYDRLKAGVKVTQAHEYEVPEQPTVYLTFDDGPGKLTPKVLDILKEADIKATFFVLGEHVKQYPAAIQRMAEEGHSIGNHTYNHQYNNLYPDFRLFWDQIRLTDQALLEAANINTNLVRAPGGTFSHFDAFSFYYLDQAGYAVFDWNVDSGDALRANVPKGEIVRNVTSTPLKHEMVVLMHDSSGHDESVRALPEVISFYKEKGYQFKPLSSRVKPVQSSLDKGKKSSVTREEHANWLVRTQEAAALKAALNDPLPAPAAPVKLADLPAEEPMSVVVMAATSAPVPARPPLKLHFEGDSVELAPSQYSFKEEKLYVPLRTLAEGMGGLVTWDGERKTASVSYGLYELKVDLQNRTLSVQAPGSADRILPLADIGMRDGAVMVPLRKTVELLGGKVEGFSFQQSLKEVELDVHARGYGVVTLPKLPGRV